MQLAIGQGDSVPLVLWDSYAGFARLFTKVIEYARFWHVEQYDILSNDFPCPQGDTIFIEKPYARPTNSDTGSSCLEFGPATLLYVLPYVPEQV